MKTKSKSVLSKIITGFVIFFFSIALLVMFLGIRSAVSNKPMMIFGYTYSVVPTPSMEPEIHVGDFVISKKTPFNELQVGDDIIYYSSEYGIYIIHRIIGINPDGSLTVKGINNSSPDDKPVTEDLYVAKRVWNGGLGGAGKLVTGYKGIIFLLLIIVLLFVFLTEFYSILRQKNEEKIKQQEQEKQDLLKAQEEVLRQIVLEELELEKQKKEAETK